MAEEFGEYLTRLRHKARLTNEQLGKRADVPTSLIGGLQSGRRRIGELQARKIGLALGLEGKELDTFILAAVDTSTEKVLEESKGYPATFLNLIARQLRRNNILPGDLRAFDVADKGEESVIKLFLNNGSIVNLVSQVRIA